MLNFIQVSFSFLLFLGLGLGSVIGLGFKGLGFGINNLKIFDRWHCKHIGQSPSLDACADDKDSGGGRRVCLNTAQHPVM